MKYLAAVTFIFLACNTVSVSIPHNSTGGVGNMGGKLSTGGSADSGASGANESGAGGNSCDLFTHNCECY